MLDVRDISAADAQQLGVALAGNGAVNAPMPFSAGLSVNEVYGAFAWRDLPGLHTRTVFQATSWFRGITASTSGSFSGASFGSGHNGNICFTNGHLGYRNSGSRDLGAAATGCHESLLGSVFTTGTSIIIASTEADKTFTPAGLYGITRPCEINGFIFFTACIGGLEVIAYLPPPFAFNDATLGNTEALQRRVQHFSSEHLGSAARIGLWQGKIALATTKGIWEIKALSDGQGYGIGAQIESWNLSPEVQFAITHDDIWALDQGVLMRRGAGGSELIHGCGFTVLNSDGRIAVLSEPGGRFAVSNGSDFEEFGGDQRAKVVGTLLGFGGGILSTERVAWTGVPSIWLTTAWAQFPNMVAVEDIFLDPAVLQVKVLTETGTYDLMRSSVAPALWRAGYSGTRLKILIEVPVGSGITAPIFKLKRRTVA